MSHMAWVILASVSALLSAAAAITQKRILFRATALEFSFLVSLAILALSAFVPFTMDVAALDSRTFALLLGKSVLGGAAFLLVMMALERNQISNALPLLGLTPAVTAVLAILLIHESLRPGQWAGLALMVAGTYALEARPGEGFLGPIRAAFGSGRHRFMFGAIALFALSSVADKLLVTGMRVPPFVVLFYQHIVYCLLFGVLLLARRQSWGTIVRRGREHLPLILLVAVLTIGYRFFQLRATQVGPVALVLAVKRTSIVYASFFGGRLFSDDRLAPRLLGAAIIVGAGFLFLGFE